LDNPDVAMSTQHLKKLTNKMADTKKLIKEYERVALSEGSMDAESLASMKKQYVSKLNDFVQMKKEEQTKLTARANAAQLEESARGSSSATSERPAATASGASASTSTAFALPAFKPKNKDIILEDEQLMQMEAGDLIQHGRNVMDQTDQSIMRSEAVVEETIQIGALTAEALRGQTTQLERIVDDLDEIHFSLKKSFAVIKDMTRGLATDKCIMLLLFLVIAGVVTVVVLRFLK
jgi:novel plant SNARE